MGYDIYIRNISATVSKNQVQQIIKIYGQVLKPISWFNYTKKYMSLKVQFKKKDSQSRLMIQFAGFKNSLGSKPQIYDKPYCWQCIEKPTPFKHLLFQECPSRGHKTKRQYDIDKLIDKIKQVKEDEKENKNQAHNNVKEQIMKEISLQIQTPTPENYPLTHENYTPTPEIQIPTPEIQTPTTDNQTPTIQPVDTENYIFMNTKNGKKIKIFFPKDDQIASFQDKFGKILFLCKDQEKKLKTDQIKIEIKQQVKQKQKATIAQQKIFMKKSNQLNKQQNKNLLKYKRSQKTKPKNLIKAKQIEKPMEESPKKQNILFIVPTTTTTTQVQHRKYKKDWDKQEQESIKMLTLDQSSILYTKDESQDQLDQFIDKLTMDSQLCKHKIS